MAIITNPALTKDPIKGLLNYVLEVKPYRTKIVETLIEYVHVDCINIAIAEKLDMCITMGAPFIDTILNDAVIGIDSGLNALIVAGDKTNIIQNGTIIRVINSSNNNGYYLATDIYFSGGNTYFIVKESIPTTDIGGVIVVHAMSFCPTGSTITGHVSPSTFSDCSDGFGSIWEDSPGPLLNIIDVEPVTNYFVISGDHTTDFTYPKQFRVQGSFGNNGLYIVLHSVVDGVNTRIYTLQDILGSKPVGQTYDGQLSLGGIGFDGQYLCDSNNLYNHDASLLAKTAIVETLSFDWTLSNWFTRMIIGVNLVGNFFSTPGNHVGDFQIGQEIDVVSSSNNNGVYHVIGSAYDSVLDITKVYVTEIIASNVVDGFLTPSWNQNSSLSHTLNFHDFIGTTYLENNVNVAIDSSGFMIGGFDIPFFDLGGFDENIQTVVASTL